jgi:hypothetical protein
LSSNPSVQVGRTIEYAATKLCEARAAASQAQTLDGPGTETEDLGRLLLVQQPLELSGLTIRHDARVTRAAADI